MTEQPNTAAGRALLDAFVSDAEAALGRGGQVLDWDGMRRRILAIEAEAEARQHDASALREVGTRDPWVMAGDHPESRCGRCAHANVWSWSAPSPLWNAVLRDPETGADAYGVVCPPCFSELASLKGLGGKPLDGLPRWSWRFAPDIPDEEIAALWADRDGRVWDPVTWLWQDRALAALPPSAPPALDVERLRGLFEQRFDDQMPDWMTKAFYAACAEYARLQGPER